MHPRKIDILMYHSLSEGWPVVPGADVFQQHLEVLASCGYQVISLADFIAWRRGERQWPAHGRCDV